MTRGARPERIRAPGRNRRRPGVRRHRAAGAWRGILWPVGSQPSVRAAERQGRECAARRAVGVPLVAADPAEHGLVIPHGQHRRHADDQRERRSGPARHGPPRGAHRRCRRPTIRRCPGRRGTPPRGASSGGVESRPNALRPNRVIQSAAAITRSSDGVGRAAIRVDQGAIDRRDLGIGRVVPDPPASATSTSPGLTRR